MKTVMACILAVLFASGCATYNVRLSGREYVPESHSRMYPERVYPATVEDARWISFLLLAPLAVAVSSDEPGSCWMALCAFPIGLVGIIDMPFSLVSDTIMLPLDLMGKGRVREQAAPAGQEREFILNVGQTNTNVPNTILVSSSGYPQCQASFRLPSGDDPVVVEIGETFRSGGPPRTYRLVYADSEKALIVFIPDSDLPPLPVQNSEEIP